MDVFRLATPGDSEAISKFTSSADAGLTTVPRTRERVDAYIDATHRFLNGDPDANRLLFVVEADGQVMGISGIIPKLGLERPFYSFKRSRHARRSSQLDMRIEYETLQLTTDFDGWTELASIYLAPEARGKGIARLLSLGRLCFIESHRELFNARIMSDIRGWVDENGKSPFWEHLTSKFIATDFDVADRLSASDGRFIMELLPSLPILMNLLPDDTRKAVGRAHDISRGAMNLLLGAGFEETELCDIFDGGPAIQCRTDQTLIADTARTLSFHGSGTQRVLAFKGEGTEFAAIQTTGNIQTGTLIEDARPFRAERLALAGERRA